MATPFRARWLATAAMLFALLTPAAEARAQWSYSFNGLFNNGGQTVVFNFETAGPIASPFSVTPTTCSLTPALFNNETYSCGISTFEQNGFGTGLDFLDFGYQTTDANGGGGSGAGWYFFDAGAFSNVGTWNTVTPTTGGVGNAGAATLTVTYTPPATVPEPSSAMLLAMGLGGLAVAWSRRRLSV